MNIPLLDKRVGSLEEMMADLEFKVEEISREMREFKEETHRTKHALERSDPQVRNYSEEEARERAERLQERRDYNQWRAKIAKKNDTMVEDLVAPVICEVLRRWFDVPSPYKCSTSVDCCCSKPVTGAKVHRFELIADCGEYTVVNITNYSLDHSDIPKIMNTVRDYRECQPTNYRLNLIGCLAALEAEVSVIKYASSHGILVLGVGDDLMDVMNEPGFKPRIF